MRWFLITAALLLAAKTVVQAQVRGNQTAVIKACSTFSTATVVATLPVIALRNTSGGEILRSVCLTRINDSIYRVTRVAPARNGQHKDQQCTADGNEILQGCLLPSATVEATAALPGKCT